MIGHQVMTNPNLLSRSIIDFGDRRGLFDDSYAMMKLPYSLNDFFLFYLLLLNSLIFAIKLFYCHFQHFLKFIFYFLRHINHIFVTDFLQ